MVESVGPAHQVVVAVDSGGIMFVPPWGSGGAIRYMRAVAQAKRDGNPDYRPEWSLAGRVRAGQRVELVKTEHSSWWGAVRWDKLEWRVAEHQDPEE